MSSIYVVQGSGGFTCSMAKYLNAKKCEKCKLWIPDEHLLKESDGLVYSQFATWDDRKKLPLNTCQQCQEKLLNQ